MNISYGELKGDSYSLPYTLFFSCLLFIFGLSNFFYYQEIKLKLGYDSNNGREVPINELVKPKLSTEVESQSKISEIYDKLKKISYAIVFYISLNEIHNYLFERGNFNYCLNLLGNFLFRSNWDEKSQLYFYSSHVRMRINIYQTLLFFTIIGLSLILFCKLGGVQLLPEWFNLDYVYEHGLIYLVEIQKMIERYMNGLISEKAYKFIVTVFDAIYHIFTGPTNSHYYRSEFGDRFFLFSLVPLTNI